MRMSILVTFGFLFFLLTASGVGASAYLASDFYGPLISPIRSLLLSGGLRNIRANHTGGFFAFGYNQYAHDDCTCKKGATFVSLVKLGTCAAPATGGSWYYSAADSIYTVFKTTFTNSTVCEGPSTTELFEGANNSEGCICWPNHYCAEGRKSIRVKGTFR